MNRCGICGSGTKIMEEAETIILSVIGIALIGWMLVEWFVKGR